MVDVMPSLRTRSGLLKTAAKTKKNGKERDKESEDSSTNVHDREEGCG